MDKDVENIKNEKKSPWQIFLTWISIIASLAMLFGILAGYTLNPDNHIFKILWFALWLGVLPTLLIWSYVIITRKK